MNIRPILAFVTAGVLALALAPTANAANEVEMRLSSWLPAAHPMSKWLDQWAAELKEKSKGRIAITTYHSGQLGPVTQHYDMVRKGTVDIGFILHGMNSDRFPLTGLVDIPFLAKTSVQGTQIINNSALREKYLDAEHRGLHVLMLLTNQPAQIHTADKAIERPDDLKGQRIRFPTAVAKAWLDQMGATSVGLPPSAIAENLQKKVIDGVMIDYGGAGVAYKLGGMVGHVAELDAYITSFGLVMYPGSYEKLPKELRSLFDDSLRGRETEVGQAWDMLNAPGKQALQDGGAVVNVPEGADRAAFEQAAAVVKESVLGERDKAGVPASATYMMMQEIAKRTKP